MEYLNRHPTEETTTEEVHDEEFVMITLSEPFKLNRKYGQFLNSEQKFRSTDQSANMSLKTNQELVNEIASPMKSIPDTNSNDFTHEQAPAINTINTTFNPINKNNNFELTDSKTEKQLNYE